VRQADTAGDRSNCAAYAIRQAIAPGSRPPNDSHLRPRLAGRYCGPATSSLRLPQQVRQLGDVPLHREHKLERHHNVVRRQLTARCGRGDGGDSLPCILGAIFSRQMPVQERESGPRLIDRASGAIPFDIRSGAAGIGRRSHSCFPGRF